MSAPASEEVREVERWLVIAQERGEPMSFSDIRSEVGIGHDELVAALDVLREHGRAVEVAPGEWLPGSDVLDAEPARHRVVSIEVPEEHAPLFVPPLVADVGPAVRITRAIADALEADAIGKIVKAGLEGAPAGQPFVLEVFP